MNEMKMIIIWVEKEKKGQTARIIAYDYTRNRLVFLKEKDGVVCKLQQMKNNQVFGFSVEEENLEKNIWTYIYEGGRITFIGTCDFGQLFEKFSYFKIEYTTFFQQAERLKHLIREAEFEKVIADIALSQEKKQHPRTVSLRESNLTQMYEEDDRMENQSFDEYQEEAFWGKGIHLHDENQEVEENNGFRQEEDLTICDDDFERLSAFYERLGEQRSYDREMQRRDIFRRKKEAKRDMERERKKEEREEARQALLEKLMHHFSNNKSLLRFLLTRISCSQGKNNLNLEEILEELERGFDGFMRYKVTEENEKEFLINYDQWASIFDFLEEKGRYEFPDYIFKKARVKRLHVRKL